jgi:hypothetical protein
MEIIEITKISEDKKKIFFTSEEEGILTIRIHDEFVESYSNTFYVSPGFTYWVSWLCGWYDMKISFDVNGKLEEFTLAGTKKDFIDPYFGGFVKKIVLPGRTSLCEIMDKNGSDKASRPAGSFLAGHNYSRFYYDLFLEKSGEKIEIFELGLGTNNPDLPSSMGSNGHPCASLRSWEDFFPNGNIFGADIDVNILIDSVRSKTFYCDQTSPKIIHQMWGHKDLLRDFDIIIEDGLHEFLPNVTFLENSLHKIKKRGYFIIEDISIGEIFNWTEYFKKNRDKYSGYEYNFISLDCEYNRYDNNLIVIRKK